MFLHVTTQDHNCQYIFDRCGYFPRHLNSECECTNNFFQLLFQTVFLFSSPADLFTEFIHSLSVDDTINISVLLYSLLRTAEITEYKNFGALQERLLVLLTLMLPHGLAVLANGISWENVTLNLLRFPHSKVPCNLVSQYSFNHRALL